MSNTTIHPINTSKIIKSEINQGLKESLSLSLLKDQLQSNYTLVLTGILLGFCFPGLIFVNFITGTIWVTYRLGVRFDVIEATNQVGPVKKCPER